MPAAVPAPRSLNVAQARVRPLRALHRGAPKPGQPLAQCQQPGPFPSRMAAETPYLFAVPRSVRSGRALLYYKKYIV